MNEGLVMGVAVKQEWVDAAQAEGWEDRPRRWGVVRKLVAMIRSRLARNTAC